jgi:probable F420-dependent oxidoreductase
MHIGAVFPQTEIGADPGGVRAFAEAVQELGFDHLHAYDHVLGAERASHPGFSGPYDSESMFHEILVVFGFIAAVVPQLELVTGIVIAPQRQTALLAKQAAEVDILTGGNFRLGLGLGWNAVEYEALGMNFHDRGRRLDEQIELMRRLWTEPVVTFEGQWHRITAAGLKPLPVQRPIPIWIGGYAERALHRAARLADGYFPRTANTPPPEVERVRELVREQGRDPESFGIDARVSVGEGTPDDWRRAADAWREAGASHLTLVTMGGGLAGPDAHAARLEEALAALR